MDYRGGSGFDRCGRRTGCTLGCVASIDIAGNNGNGFSDFGLCENVVAGSCAADVSTARLPLVTDDTETVSVCKRIGCGQSLTLGGGASDGDAAGRQVVYVEYSRRCSAGLAFYRALTVGVTCNNGDGFANFSLGQSVGVRSSAADVRVTRFPLVADSAETVYIGESVCRCIVDPIFQTIV